MKRPLGFFLLAGVAAMLAALVVYSALKKREAEVKQAMVHTVDIVIAAKNLPLGAKIDASSLKLAKWPRKDVPPGSFTNPGPVIGAFVKSSFVQNEPIVSSKLFMGQKTAGVLPLLIPAGMRAMSVPVDDVSDISGFVLPRAHVDVVVAMQAANGQRPVSKVVLQDVEVLAVAQEIEGNKDKPKLVKVVTLLVTPIEAERLALASREGQLRLALRNYNDNKIVPTSGVDIAQLLSAYAPTAPVLASQRSSHRHVRARVRRLKKTFHVEIMRNGKDSKTVSFVHEAAATQAIENGLDPVRSASAMKSQTRVASRSHDSGHRGTQIASTASDATATTPASPHSEVSSAAYVPTPKTIDIP